MSHGNQLDNELCMLCGDPTPMGTDQCTNCYEVEKRIDEYLKTPRNLEYIQERIEAITPWKMTCRIFKPSGKWYTEAHITIPGNIHPWEVDEWIIANDPFEGRLRGMTLVGHYRNDVPFIMTIPGEY